MEQILRAFGYSEEQIQDAVKHCNSVEEAILYIPSVPKDIKHQETISIPDPYTIENSSEDVVDLIDDDSTSSNIEDDSDDNSKDNSNDSDDDSDDSELERTPDDYNFKGDTVYLNRLIEIHKLNDLHYVNFNRLFSTTDSRKHDTSISHIFLSSYLYSDSILDPILSKHQNAEITCAFHLDPDNTNRSPLVMNEGKHIFVFPPFPNIYTYGCFHPKLILIRFKDRLRVVISSANLLEQDWYYWSQCIWMQDFFNGDEKRQLGEKKLDLEFRTELISFLRSCKCPEDRIFNLLKNVYFQNVHVRLVASIPNKFQKRNYHRYGHMRLRTIIHDLYDYYDTVTNHPVTSVSPILSLCSSVGSPSSDWLKSILSSCNGGKDIPKTTPISDLFHLVFPTNAYVSNSRIGTDMAGSLILKRTSYMRSTFPKKSLKRYKDCKGRENSLPHAKYIMNVPLRNHPRLPWVYVGSHNFTRSAWGSLSKKDDTFNISNYECGVVLLPTNFVKYYNGDLKKEDYKPEMAMDDYCNPVDLAFDIPCLPYREDDIPFLTSCYVCSIFIHNLQKDTWWMIDKHGCPSGPRGYVKAVMCSHSRVRVPLRAFFVF